MALNFRAKVGKILVKPRKAKDSIKTAPENIYISDINGKDGGNCPRTLVKVNRIYNVNALLDRRLFLPL